MKTGALILTILMLTSPAVQSQDVVPVSVAMKGEKISNGICWRFVSEALKRSNTTIDSINKFDEGQPGDVFVIHGFYSVEVTYVAYVLSGMGAHVAIVLENLGDNKYRILHQNAEGNRGGVTEGFIDLTIKHNTFCRGYVFFRPYEGELTRQAQKLFRRTTTTKAFNKQEFKADGYR